MNMKKPILILTILLGVTTSVIGQAEQVVVQNTDEGWELHVNGEPKVINGMNWDYFPIGTNFNYSLWNQTPEFIKQALDDEMALLQNMGVNSIRVYTGSLATQYRLF